MLHNKRSRCNQKPTYRNTDLAEHLFICPFPILLPRADSVPGSGSKRKATLREFAEVSAPSPGSLLEGELISMGGKCRRKSREKSKENTEYLKTQKNEGWCMAS